MVSKWRWNHDGSIISSFCFLGRRFFPRCFLSNHSSSSCADKKGSVAPYFRKLGNPIELQNFSLSVHTHSAGCVFWVQITDLEWLLETSENKIVMSSIPLNLAEIFGRICKAINQSNGCRSHLQKIQVFCFSVNNYNYLNRQAVDQWWAFNDAFSLTNWSSFFGLPKSIDYQKRDVTLTDERLENKIHLICRGNAATHYRTLSPVVSVQMRPHLWAHFRADQTSEKFCPYAISNPGNS